jgi:glycosyltransferase involved in cell wall biosynthesis
MFYAAGPGNIGTTYLQWKAGEYDPKEMAIGYSRQFFDVCRRVGAEAYVISTSTNCVAVSDDQVRIEARPVPFRFRGGALYHIGQLVSGAYMVTTILRYRPDVAIVSEGTHWFVLAVLPLVGIPVIPTLHCVLWPKFAELSLPGRIVRGLNRVLFRRKGVVALSISTDVSDQVVQLAGDACPPIEPFIPNYRRELFEGIGAPPAGKPFRVLYAGRIEANKGVFDLLEMAKQLRDKGRNNIEFELCGSGSALAALREAVERAGLSEVFYLRGHCDQAYMRGALSRCHALIVPTTTDFVEGFNKVVAEGVIAGRPVITSAVCPAIKYVEGAVVEVEPNNPAAYLNALEKLVEDRDFYRNKCVSCREKREQFFDLGRGWGSALMRAISRLLKIRELPDRHAGNAEAA